ncbi:50S ribosomal protein L11 methyltransferase [bacterium]|nr:50S ribosomal protein L11 methyltransferase [bacterium]
MDIPAKFATVSPNIEDLIKEFEWRRHPLLPELEMFCLPSKNDNVKKSLQDNNHSWQWPYLWECGVALARWVLDNPSVVKDKLVYDVGTGQGTVAIAAKKAGAKISIGIDCCVFTEFTLATNGDRNGVIITPYIKDLFRSKIAEQSIIFASDLVYGQNTSNDLLDCLAELGQTSTVIIAQSGRQNPPYEIKHEAFHHLMSYDVPCFTPGLETVETMPVSLWTCNSLILKDL